LAAHLRDSGFTVDVVSERELYGPAGLRRLRDNLHALEGRRLVKVLATAYLLAPLRKPIRSPGATYQLPILVATRGGGGADPPGAGDDGPGPGPGGGVVDVNGLDGTAP
jgi:hypothetical protein